MYVDASVTVISARVSLKILDKQNKVILAKIKPTTGPPMATCIKYTTISPPVQDKYINYGKITPLFKVPYEDRMLD